MTPSNPKTQPGPKRKPGSKAADTTAKPVRAKAAGGAKAGGGSKAASTAKAPATNTLRLERILKAPRDRVFKAFMDPDAYVKWIPPNGFTGHIHEWDPKVGGRYRMSFSNIERTETHAFGGRYVEIKTNERIRYTDAFETDQEAMQGTMQVTITFEDVPGPVPATKVTVVQEGLPSVIPLDMATWGWQQSFENLARLVEV